MACMQYYRRVRRGRQCLKGEPAAHFLAGIVLGGGGRCANQRARQLVNSNADAQKPVTTE